MPQNPPKEFQKPAVLYHASSNRNVKEFMPLYGDKRYKGEPARVFAALDKSFAAIFLHPFGDDKMASGYLNDVPFVLIGDVVGFKAADKGGAIYTLPSDSFEFDPDLGVGYKEWTSVLPVKPINKENYDTALGAMLDLGVQVYMADMPTLAKFKSSDSQEKFRLVDSLQSENEKLKRNYRSIRP